MEGTLKIDELFDHLQKPDVTVEEVADSDVTLELALTLLHECGQLLDMLSDKRGTRLNRAEQGEIAKLADEVFEFLRDTDVDYGQYLAVQERT
jgi:hypothetical protein